MKEKTTSLILFVMASFPILSNAQSDYLKATEETKKVENYFEGETSNVFGLFKATGNKDCVDCVEAKVKAGTDEVYFINVTLLAGVDDEPVKATLLDSDKATVTTNGNTSAYAGYDGLTADQTYAAVKVSESGGSVGGSGGGCNAGFAGIAALAALALIKKSK